MLVSQAPAQSSNFHSAPESAKALKNPYQGQPTPHAKALFHLRCARCHGENGEGSGNIPALKVEKIKEVTAGEIFWFITKGDVNNGMPSWATLPKATTLADRELRANARAGAELTGQQRAGSAHGRRKIECSASEAALHRFPL